MKNTKSIIAMKDSIKKMEKLCSLQLQAEYLSNAWQAITDEINRMQKDSGWFDKYLESMLK